jgi:flagellar biogenesis protein FliO
MPSSFWVSYLLKLGVVALLLVALYAAARALRRMRLFASSADRSITVIESVALSPHVAVYLLRVGTRCFLIGTAGAALATLAELEPAKSTVGPSTHPME